MLTLLMPSLKNIHYLKMDMICSGPFNIPFRTYLLVDPSEREERVMDGLLVIAVNKHREICTIQSSGGIMLLNEQVSAVVNIPFRSFFLFIYFLTKIQQGHFQ